MHRSTFLTAAVAVLVTCGGAHAACNLLPSASQTFRSTVGATNKPFAAPGDFVEVSVRPTGCDVTSPGLQPLATDHHVTLVFTPPANGPRRVVLLTAGTCAAIATQQDACEAGVGGPDYVRCVEGSQAALALVDRNGVDHLSFRFPDTTGLFAASGFSGTLAGPVRIAVTKATDPLPCGLATATCATQAGTIACIDGIYNADGTCQPNPHLTFPGFTALPRPNDYEAACFKDDPPCDGTAPDTAMAVDVAGNLLMPVNWTGILVRDAGIPVPRLLNATLRSPLPFAQPPTVAFGSYTPEGAPLPPIFEPQVDPTATAPNTLSIVGTADAAYTILRVARRHGTCNGGPTPGAPCTQSPDCGSGGTCPVACAGGTTPEAGCTKDSDCGGGGLCGALFTDFRPLAKPGGPVVLTRTTNLVCQEEPHQSCTVDSTCTGITNTCVAYALEARTPVPLEGLAGSDDVFAFAVRENIAQKYLNVDADQVDRVLLLQDRATGRQLPIGAGESLGLPVMATQQPPFTYPMLATEDRVVAFLQPEAFEATAPAQANANGDDDAFDTILRVFRENLEGTSADELTVAPAFPTPLAVDAALRVNGRSLAVSQGVVFFRTPEDGAVEDRTMRVSVSDTGAEANGPSGQDGVFGNPLSADGRFVVFQSTATNLVAGGTSSRQVFLRDRDLDGNGIFDEAGGGAQTTELVSKTLGGVEGIFGSSRPTISADGRYVAFATGATNLITGAGPTCPNGYAAPAGPCFTVVVKDRTTGAVVTISRQDALTAGNGDSDFPSITPDGRFLVFQSTASNLVPGDTNDFCDNNFDTIATDNCADVFVHDRDSDENGIFDEVGGTATERVSLDENDGEVDGPSLYGAISDDGRFVVFQTAEPLVASDLAGDDVYLRDRLLGTTTVVTGHPSGVGTVGGYFPSISGSGRHVAFESGHAFVPGPGSLSAWAWDRLSDAYDHLNQSSEGSHGSPGIAGAYTVFSTDGRFATVLTQSPNVVPGKTFNCRGTAGDCYDFYVRDRVAGLTKWVSVTDAGTEMSGETVLGSGITPDGRTVSFTTGANDLIGPGNDTNICDMNGLPPLDPCGDVFVRTRDYTQAAMADRTGDDDFDDTLLEVLDTATSTRTALCPATDVAVTDGKTAFIRPAAAGATPDLPLCPGGTPASDAVHFWPGSGAVQDLGLPGGGARTVALSANYVAAIGTTGTLQVKPTAGGPWVDSGLMPHSIQFCGDVVALLEDAGGGYSTLRLYAPGAGTLPLDVGGVQEVVCNDELIAYRVDERFLASSQNDDPAYPDDDGDDHVLYTYDLATPACRTLAATPGCTGDPQRAVTACRLAACDPRVPYRVNGATVKFLTFEDEQGQHDLNGDGDATDYVISVYDMESDTVVPYGTIPGDSTQDPFPGGDVGDGEDPTSSGDGAVYSTTGRCLETIGTACTGNADCAPGEFCDDLDTMVCMREHGVCVTADDCPPGLPCVTTGAQAGTTAASPDTDTDGIPDHVDNCPEAANGAQVDGDGDGVGDACDLATCGNDVLEYDEQCDGASPNTCTAGCQANCTCAPCGATCAACDNPILDSSVRVVLKTVNELGILVAKATLPLASFDAVTPVTVRLEDVDSHPIVQARVAAVPAKGTNFIFKSKSDGLQKILVKQRAPGEWLVKVKGKRWFTAEQADQPAADTLLTLTIGTQCFTHAGTAKIE